MDYSRVLTKIFLDPLLKVFGRHMTTFLGFVVDYLRVCFLSLLLAFDLHKSCMLDSICPRKLNNTSHFSIVSDLNRNLSLSLMFCVSFRFNHITSLILVLNNQMSRVCCICYLEIFLDIIYCIIDHSFQPLGIDILHSWSSLMLFYVSTIIGYWFVGIYACI
jgi:hypothetical protein